MKKSRQIVLGIVFVLLLAMVAPVAASSFTVDNGNPDCDDTEGRPFCTIQAAIDAARPGDRIRVEGDDFANFYNESVTVYKERITLEGRNNPIVAPLALEPGILVVEDRVKVEGFVVGLGVIGIVVDADRVSVRENIVGLNLEAGILLDGVERAEVIENLTAVNVGPGILAGGSYNSRIEKNLSVLNLPTELLPDADLRISSERFPKAAEVSGLFATMLDAVDEAVADGKNGEPAATGKASKAADNDTDDEGERADLLARATHGAYQAGKGPGYNWPATGIWVIESEKIRVKNNILVANFFGGVLVEDSVDNRIETNEFYINWTGLTILDAHDNLVRKNEFAFNVGPASILIMESSTENLIDDNRVYAHLSEFIDGDYSACVLVDDYSIDNRFLSNEVMYCEDFGFWIWSNGNEFDQNDAMYNGSDGFHVGPAGDSSEGVFPAASNNIFDHNRAIENDTDGFDDEGSGNFYNGNTAEMNGGDGFEIDQGHFMQRNTSRENYGDGFAVDHDYNTLVKNEARENYGQGFDINGSYNHLEDNESVENQDGYQLGDDEPAMYNTLIDNWAKFNEYEGFDLLDDADYNELYDNQSRHNGDDGFDIAGDNNTLEDNSAYDNGNKGFYDAGTGNSYGGNQCGDNVNGSDAAACAE